MKNFVKEITRYFKLPFKFIYWSYGLIFFLFIFIYLKLRFKKNKGFKKYEESVVCVSHVAISFDGRIKKCANQILKLGFPVILIKPCDVQESKDFESSGLDKNVQIKKVGLSGSFAYFPCVFDFLMLMYLIFCKSKYIHCHDINTAFMGVFASKITGKILISDLHEWKSETSNLDKKNQNILQKKLFQIIESTVIEQSDFVIAVNETIANNLKKKINTKKDVLIVKNCPDSSRLQKYNIRSHLNIPKECLIGYYVGQMAPYRNLVQIIKGLSSCQKICLVFQGTIDNHYLQILRDTCDQNSVSHRVFFLPAIPYNLIPSACQGADFGIFSCSVESKSMYSALPNKLFEYIAGGIPILSEDIPLMRECIERYNIGVMFNSNNIDSITKAYNYILNESNLETIKQNLISLRKNFIEKTNKENLSAYSKIYRPQNHDTI